MNIEGLSEATLAKFFDEGWLQSFVDIYSLSQHKDEIVAIEGFGEKSYNNMIESIEKSRNTTFENFLVAMDIPLVGKSASKIFKSEYNNDLTAFVAAVNNNKDFTEIEKIGNVINANIHEWFANTNNRSLWDKMYGLMTFAKTSAPISQEVAQNPFKDKIVVATGEFDNFTRKTINEKLESLGATASGSVSKKTNYVITGEKAGSKLAKAQELGITVLNEVEFISMIGM